MATGAKNQWLIKAIAALYGRKETVIGDDLGAAKPKDSKTHWKFAALKTAVKRHSGQHHHPDRQPGDLTGLTGQGGEMFDTQMRLKELASIPLSSRHPPPPVIPTDLAHA